jgi:hypothetical protein
LPWFREVASYSYEVTRALAVGTIWFRVQAKEIRHEQVVLEAPAPGTTRTTIMMTTIAPVSYVAGASYAALLAGAMSIKESGQIHHLSGNTRFQPAFGANGVHYMVVPAP